MVASFLYFVYYTNKLYKFRPQKLGWAVSVL